MPKVSMDVISCALIPSARLVATAILATIYNLTSKSVKVSIFFIFGNNTGMAGWMSGIKETKKFKDLRFEFW